MNRHLTYYIGPETTLTAFSLLLFWFYARHNSGEGRDVALMEWLIWLLPFVVTPVAFATIVVPGAKSWWWLSRAIVFTHIALVICGWQLINGLGSGAKGQDAAFILLLVGGAVAVSLATAVSGAVILATTKPGFASWFQAHKVLGSLLTFISALPIGIVLGIGASVGLGVFGGIYTTFKR